MSSAFERLRNGVVLAELGGHGDGPYCAKHGAGCALVILGTYIVDPGDSVPYPQDFVFRPGPENYRAYLERHVAAARKSGAAVGVSVVTVDPEDTIDFLRAAEGAGTDYVSVCLHSAMAMFVSVGLSSALLDRERWPLMRERISAYLAAVGVPLIVKLGTQRSRDWPGAVEQLTELGVPCIHADVGDATSPNGLDAIAELRARTPFLIAGGGMRDADGARRALGAGADAVAVARVAMVDSALCGRLHAELRT